MKAELKKVREAKEGSATSKLFLILCAVFLVGGLTGCAMLEAQREAQREEDRAIEEANRYDPAKFAIVPDDFKPAAYVVIDLFDAVAVAEKQDWLSLSNYITPYQKKYGSAGFASDVVFDRQNGTDIWFQTVDGAISQHMKVSARSELTSGQSVRIYYNGFFIPVLL
jgi:hypothetical protein